MKCVKPSYRYEKADALCSGAAAAYKAHESDDTSDHEDHHRQTSKYDKR